VSSIDNGGMCMLMCIHMLTKRTNILFEQQTWNQLVQLAKEKSTSVGELTRNAVQDVYFKNDQYETVAQAVASTKKVRKKLKKIDYKALINYGRKY